MFKKIKKLYFKIYHLFKLLSVFILLIGIIPKVKADELPSCYDEILVPYTIGNYAYPPLWNENTKQWTEGCGSTFSGSKPLQVLIPMYENKPTYIKFPKSATGNNVTPWALVGYNENKTGATCQVNASINTYISVSYDMDKKLLTITPKEGNTYKYISLAFSTMLSYNNYTRPVPWGDQTEGNIAISDEDISECPVAPTPEGNEVYNNFIDLYVNRIQNLATGFTNNPYLLAMIGIIIGWIVLELFLRVLHLKGGYKK